MKSKKFAIASVIGLFIMLFVSACGGQSQQPSTQNGTGTVAQSQRDVTYPGFGGVTLAGTLVIPTHKSGVKAPGVIIIAGSGAVDRNGNEGSAFQTNLYSQLADQLARQGIASLRYDKRGVGASTPYPLPKDPNNPKPAEVKAMQDFAAWDNFVEDARASLNFLQQQPEIDPAHTAMIGHSEGSMIAGLVGAMTSGLAHPPAALVLIGAPGRPFDVVLRDQIARQLAAQPGIPSGFVLSRYDEIIASLRQTGKPSAAAFADLQANKQVPAQFTQALESLFIAYNDEYWQGVLKVDPAATLKHYPGPVLILQGGSDIQVSPTKDTPLLDAALKSRTPDDHQTTIIPNTSHNMKAVQNPATDPGITGPVVPQCTDTLRHWLAEKF